MPEKAAAMKALLDAELKKHNAIVPTPDQVPSRGKPKKKAPTKKRARS
jgi:hypothetical protein